MDNADLGRAMAESFAREQASKAQATITTLLQSIEGMQGQIQAMTELIVQLEQRISDLEHPKPRKLIQVRN